MIRGRKKIRVRGGGSWKEGCNTICIAVSINSPKCAGEDFLAALDYVEKSGKDFFIDLSDTLHAPNLVACGSTIEDARAFSTLMGNKWLSDLDEHLDGVHVIRWSHWHSHPEYKKVLSHFNQLYDNDETFQGIVNHDINHFVDRAPERKKQDFFQASKNYIIDECAGKTLQGRTYPNLAILYPGLELECLSAVREGAIIDAPCGLDNTQHIRYTIETRKAFKGLGQNNTIQPQCGDAFASTRMTA